MGCRAEGEGWEEETCKVGRSPGGGGGGILALGRRSSRSSSRTCRSVDHHHHYCGSWLTAACGVHTGLTDPLSDQRKQSHVNKNVPSTTKIICFSLLPLFYACATINHDKLFDKGRGSR